jgi:hypothetical protein
MALPPLDNGAVQLTTAWEFPAVAVTADGTPGTVNGVTLLEGSDVAPLPAALAAVTVKVYGVPLVRPVTVALVGTSELPAGAVMTAVAPAGLEATV